jgi:para-aminobenzoate synthetase component 1
MHTLVEPLAPAVTPEQVFRRLSRWPYALFLDSAQPGTKLGRYSFLTADPFEVLCVSHKGVESIPRSDPAGRTALEANPSRSHLAQGSARTALLRSAGLGGVGQGRAADPFALLAERLQPFRQDTLPDLPPFQGGAAGLLSYEVCHYLERLPRARHDEFQPPDVMLGLYDWVVAFDHAKGEAWCVSTGFPEMQSAARQQRAARRLRAVRKALAGPARSPHAPIASGDAAQRRLVPSAPQWPVPVLDGLTSNFSRDRYLEAVRRAIEYIYAGDVFQVNIAQRLLFPATMAPAELYLRLRQRNPAPFGGYFDLGNYVIASASPERFLQVRGREVETRPIKGTRHRGLTPEADLFTRDALQASEKDRAENVMIVDLLRNDLSRVCRPGTVQVPQLCEVEFFQYVQHLVSEVRGRLRDGFSAIDALRAAFPGGSITGAPKVRACEIIAELEPTARGPYCGCLAYVGFDGSMDTSILIRTMTCGRGWLQLPVGGGIVAQSVPEHEYEETLDKAEGMLRALV